MQHTAHHGRDSNTQHLTVIEDHRLSVVNIMLLVARRPESVAERPQRNYFASALVCRQQHFQSPSVSPFIPPRLYP